MTQVVIVGGGFGGLSCARELTQLEANVQITIVDRLNHHLFQPLLYQVAMAGLSPADVAYPIRTIFRHKSNVSVLLGEVTRIDLAARSLELFDGSELRYDYLILSAGARTNWFGNQAFREHTLGLKSIDDAIEIRRRVLLAFEAAEREPDADQKRRLLTFAIIGGGPTGVEIAGALSELARWVLAEDFRSIDPAATRVVLIEMQPRLLPGGFDDQLAARAKEQLEELGVEVRLSSPVKSIDELGVELENERIDAATVLWTAGVRAEALTETLGVKLDRAGRVEVEPDCSIPGHPEAFAIGDIIRFAPDGGEPLPGIAPVAMQQGRHVARAIAADLERGQGHERDPFVYKDKGIMATIGRSRAIVQSGGGRLKLSGLIAWILWIFIHIWYLIGFRNRVSVLLNWAWNYLSYRQGARLITGESAWRLMPEIASPSDVAHANASEPDGERQRAPAPPA